VALSFNLPVLSTNGRIPSVLVAAEFPQLHDA
jgi:hypothetical protein